MNLPLSPLKLHRRVAYPCARRYPQGHDGVGQTVPTVSCSSSDIGVRRRNARRHVNESVSSICSSDSVAFLLSPDGVSTRGRFCLLQKVAVLFLSLT